MSSQWESKHFPVRREREPAVVGGGVGGGVRGLCRASHLAGARVAAAVSRAACPLCLALWRNALHPGF